jgi:hypothetical protein
MKRSSTLIVLKVRFLLLAGGDVSEWLVDVSVLLADLGRRLVRTVPLRLPSDRTKGMKD